MIKSNYKRIIKKKDGDNMLKAKAQRTIGLKNEKTLKQAAVAVIVALMSVAATQSRILGYLSPINVVIAAAFLRLRRPLLHIL